MELLFLGFIVCGCGFAGIVLLIVSGLAILGIRTRRTRQTPVVPEKKVYQPKLLGRYVTGKIHKLVIESPKNGSKGHLAVIKLASGDFQYILIPFEEVLVAELRINREIEFLYNPETEVVRIARRMNVDDSQVVDLSEVGEFLTGYFRVVSDVKFIA